MKGLKDSIQQSKEKTHYLVGVGIRTLNVIHVALYVIFGLIILVIGYSQIPQERYFSNSLYITCADGRIYSRNLEDPDGINWICQRPDPMYSEAKLDITKVRNEGYNESQLQKFANQRPQVRLYDSQTKNKITGSWRSAFQTWLISGAILFVIVETLFLAVRYIFDIPQKSNLKK